MLEFAAAAPPGMGELVLREHRAALELVRAVPARAREPLRARARRRLPAPSERPRPTDRARVDAARRRGARRRNSSDSSRSPRPRSCPPRRRADEHRATILLWIILPYVGDHDLPGRARLALPHRPVRLDQPLHPAAGPPHARLGAARCSTTVPLAAIGGHVIGILHPAVRDRGDRDRRSTSTACSPAVAGTLAGAVTLIGFLRPDLPPRHLRPRRRTTTRMDMLTYLLLTLLICLGCWMTFATT